MSYEIAFHTIWTSDGESVKVFNTLTKHLISLPATDWSVLRENLSKADPSLVEYLVARKILVPSGTDQTRFVKDWMDEARQRTTTLLFKCLVTERCDCICPMCIMGGPGARDMSMETARATVRFCKKTMDEKAPRRVVLVVSGGEAFKNPSVVMEIAGALRDHCSKKGIAFSFSIITNGRNLNARTIECLHALGLDTLNVSLLGPADIHDQMRPARDGGNSYERIVQNMQRLTDGKSPVSFVILCQYDSGSLDYQRIPEMLQDLKQRSIPVKRIDFGPIFPSGCDSPYKAGVGDPEIFFHLQQEALRAGFLPYPDEPPANACSMDMRSRFTIAVDGSLIPCAAMAGKMEYGNVFQGIDFFARSQMRREMPERCVRECELLPSCLGGCRLLPYHKTGDFNGIDCRYDILKRAHFDYIKAVTSSSAA